MQKTVAPRRNKSTDTTRFLSPAVWQDFPVAMLRENPSLGIYDYDDFVNFPAVAIGAEAAQGKYKRFGDTGNQISRVMAHTGGAANAITLVPGGYLQLAIDTDNDEVALADAYTSLLLTNSSTNSGKLAFECCYLQNGGTYNTAGSVAGDAIPTNCASVFVGLANTGKYYSAADAGSTLTGGIALSSTVPLNDGDPIDATLVGIGFRIKEDGGGLVDTVYTDGTTGFTNIQASVATLTAYTPVKLGLVYDLNADAAKRIKFFVNNVEQTTYFTSAQLTALAALNAVGLARLFAATADSAGASFRAGLKWWAMGQIMPGAGI